jgi:O-antigen/teichoic acid export membrane protein
MTKVILTELTAAPYGAETAQPVASPSARAGRFPLALATWVSGGLNTAVTMLMGFMATPFLLEHLGAERLGAFNAAQQWTGYLGYLNLGLAWTINILLLEAVNRRDMSRTKDLTMTGFRLQLRQTLFLVFPVAAILAYVMPTLVPVQPSMRYELRVSSFIGLIALAALPFQVFRDLLSCLQLGYLVSIALLAQFVLTTGLAVFLAWMGFGLEGQYVSFVAGLLAFAAFVTCFGIRYLPGFSRATKLQLSRRELWKLRWPVAIVGVGTQVSLMTDLIVVGLILNPAAVMTFSITQRLISVVGRYATNLGGQSWPGLSEILATKGRESFQDRLLELVRLMVGFGTIVVAILAAYNRQFVSLWVGHKYYGGDLLSVVTSIQMVIVGFVLLFSFVIDALGHTYTRVTVSSSGAVLNVALSFFFAYWMGLFGVSLATVVAYLITDVWYLPYVVCRQYGVEGRAIVRSLLGAAIPAVVWAVSIWLFAHRDARIYSWFNLALELGLANAVGIVYGVVFVMTRQDRTVWLVRAQTLRRLASGTV